MNKDFIELIQEAVRDDNLSLYKSIRDANIVKHRYLLTSQPFLLHILRAKSRSLLLEVLNEPELNISHNKNAAIVYLLKQQDTANLQKIMETNRVVFGQELLSIIKYCIEFERTEELYTIVKHTSDISQPLAQMIAKYASSRASLRTIRVLGDKKGVTLTFENNIVLKNLAERGELEAIRWLSRRGEFATSQGKESAFIYAVLGLNIKLVKYLAVDLKISSIVNNYEAMYWAIRLDDRRMINLLLDLPDANVTIGNNYLIKYLIANDNKEVLDIFLAHKSVNLSFDTMKALLRVINSNETKKNIVAKIDHYFSRSTKKK